MKRFAGFALALAMGLSLVACGNTNTDAPTDSADATADVAAADDDYFADEATLEDADGNELKLTQTKEIALAGTYICGADGSVWAFGGDDLGVAYTDENGTLGCYVCRIGFYLTEKDENGTSTLYIDLYNLTNGANSVWRVDQVVDENDNQTGLALTDIESTNQILLFDRNYYEEQSASGDAE